MPTYIVVTTDYATNRIIHAYGPFDRTEAENLRMALPASSSRDHAVIELQPKPAASFPKS